MLGLVAAEQDIWPLPSEKREEQVCTQTFWMYPPCLLSIRAYEKPLPSFPCRLGGVVYHSVPHPHLRSGNEIQIGQSEYLLPQAIIIGSRSKQSQSESSLRLIYGVTRQNKSLRVWVALSTATWKGQTRQTEAENIKSTWGGRGREGGKERTSELWKHNF